MKVIEDLQNTIDHKEVEIQLLSKQIMAREREQMNGAQMVLELEDMKSRKIALEEEVSSLRGAAKLSQEEVSYQEHAIAICRATPTKVIPISVFEDGGQPCTQSRVKHGPRRIEDSEIIIQGELGVCVCVCVWGGGGGGGGGGVWVCGWVGGWCEKGEHGKRGGER